MTITDQTTTCPDWCADHLVCTNYGGPGIDDNTHQGTERTIGAADLTGRLCQARLGDEPAGPVEIEISGVPPWYFTPAQARQAATALAALADAAEGTQ